MATSAPTTTRVYPQYLVIYLTGDAVQDTSILNSYGQQGWEVVGIYRQKGKICVVFRQEIVTTS